MKTYTDLNQSKKLAELGIDVNTADMWYPPSSIEYGVVNKWWEKPIVIRDIEHSIFKKEYYIPAWSLASLLSVLPKGTNISTPKPINALGYCCWNQYSEVYADNPVDACYEMILKLHELKML